MEESRSVLDMKRKGFTLIELLAVIVILAVIMLVAGQNVFGIMGEAEKGSFRNEFLSFLDSASTAAQFDIMNGNISASKNTKCYSMADLENYFELKDGYTGSVSVTYSNGQYSISGWMSSTKYIIENKDDSLTTDDVLDSDGRTASTTCGQ